MQELQQYYAAVFCLEAHSVFLSSYLKVDFPTIAFSSLEALQWAVFPMRSDLAY